jgi:hypothetical protein
VLTREGLIDFVETLKAWKVILKKSPVNIQNKWWKGTSEKAIRSLVDKTTEVSPTIDEIPVTSSFDFAAELRRIKGKPGSVKVIQDRACEIAWKLQWANEKLRRIYWTSRDAAIERERRAAKERERNTAMENERAVSRKRKITASDASQHDTTGASTTDDSDEDDLFFKDKTDNVDNGTPPKFRRVLLTKKKGAEKVVTDTPHSLQDEMQAFAKDAGLELSLGGNFVEAAVTSTVGSGAFVQQSSILAVGACMNGPFVIDAVAEENSTGPQPENKGMADTLSAEEKYKLCGSQRQTLELERKLQDTNRTHLDSPATWSNADRLMSRSPVLKNKCRSRRGR